MMKNKLKEVFLLLSETLSRRNDIEPKCICDCAKTMLEIYNTLNTSSVDDMLDIKNS